MARRPRVLHTTLLALVWAPALAQAALHPALPTPGLDLPPAAVAAMPQAPPPIGLPLLQETVSCPALQQRLLGLLGSERPVWSVTIADSSGRLLAEVNGSTPRVPASNQKLISTAYALDQLGPDYRLRSQLWRLSNGSFRLTGEGDPDLALPQLQRMVKLALGSGGGSGPPGTLVRLQIAEEPKQAWWPQGWDPDDRFYAYGAPITRLAITSNAIHEAVLNPPSRLQALLQRSALQQGGKVLIAMVSSRDPLPTDAVLLHEEPSTSMHGLLSLANTESHNFTAEVLMRQAAASWDLAEVRNRASRWLAEQGLPMQGVRVADGSGLDRANRVTSRLLAALLLRMSQHPNSRDYFASMAVMGERGTLRHYGKGTALQGRFFGKTGTLTGVRAVSGVLQTSDGPRYVSVISNGSYDPNSKIAALFLTTLSSQSCTDGSAG